MVSGSLLVALYTLSDFGAVSLMRYESFTWAIYQQYSRLLRQDGRRDALSGTGWVGVSGTYRRRTRPWKEPLLSLFLRRRTRTVGDQVEEVATSLGSLRLVCGDCCPWIADGGVYPTGS